MASKKKSAAKGKAEIRYVVLSDGTKQKIVREDGKYFYTESSQFRRATHEVESVACEEHSDEKEESEKEAE